MDATLDKVWAKIEKKNGFKWEFGAQKGNPNCGWHLDPSLYF